MLWTRLGSAANFSRLSLGVAKKSFQSRWVFLAVEKARGWFGFPVEKLFLLVVFGKKNQRFTQFTLF